MSTTPGWGVSPEPIRYSSDEPPILLTVDGQEVRVRVRAGEPGSYDFDWLNGPPGYGFGITRSARSPMSMPEMEEHIRGYLD
jgi:hypothetical protein